MNTHQFDLAAKIISRIKERVIQEKAVLELNYYAGSSPTAVDNRMTYDELSEATKVVVDIATSDLLN